MLYSTVTDKITNRRKVFVLSNLKITDRISYVGEVNPNLRVFDIVMSTEFGTSYNSYVLKGDEKVALIETAHNTFFDFYLRNVKEVVDPAKIDYIVLNHTEPDHTGSVAKILDYAKDATVITTRAGAMYLKGITNRDDINIKTPADGEVIDLGGVTLKFLSAPFLHWPDSMFSWCEEEKALFSCDFLGAHYCETNILDSTIIYPDSYKSGFKGYYEAIFGPFKPYVLSGLDKIKDFDIEYALTSHGPILTKGNMLEYAMDCYRNWSTPAVKENLSIPVFYTSAYGYTRELAIYIKEGILKALPTADVELFDIIEHPIAELQGKLNASDAFALGSPTLNRDAVPPTWELLSHVDAVNSASKSALLFGSYGWSGEAIPNMEARLKGLKIKVFPESLKVQFKPSSTDIEKAVQMGADFANSLVSK